ncbi:MAG: hypothetical protein AAGJ08_21750 [Cyanobacteria bacterium P01_H01_bin.35]
MEQEISILGLNQKAESYLAQGKLDEADTICNEALVKLEYRTHLVSLEEITTPIAI